MNTRALVPLLAAGLVLACSSDDDGAGLPSPGSSCDGSRPLVCGSLAAGGSTKNVVLFCRDGSYESVLDCKPGGNGQTNRCFAGGSGTVVDCFDEPSAGKVTRCEASGSGTSVTHSCSVGSR